MIFNKSLTFLISAIVLPLQFIAQCGDATSGTACPNTSGTAVVINSINTNTIGFGYAIPAGSTQVYTYTGVRAGTVLRFVTCSSIDMEITFSGPVGFTTIQRDADNEFGTIGGCTPNANDETFIVYCTISGDYTLKLSRHGAPDCSGLTGVVNFWRSIFNRPMAAVTPTYGASTWNRYYYDGTDHDIFYGYNLGYSSSLSFTDNWGAGQPNSTVNSEGKMCDADNFSTRYWRTETFSTATNTAGVYDIRVISEDGVRLSNNGGSSWNLVDAWDCVSHDNTATVTLDGTYNFQLEQRECTGTAQAAVSFTCLSAIGGNLSVPSSSNLITLSGHRGFVDYWESSPDGITWTNIGNAGSTTISGSAGNYYRAVIKNCSSTANSEVSYVAPDNYWAVYGLNNTGYNFANITTLASNTLQGAYSNSTLDITSSSQWAVAASPSSATGYIGSAVTTDNFTTVYRRKGFPCREYQIDLNYHDDGVVMYINNVLIYSLDGCCVDRGVIWQGVLSATDVVEFRVMDNTTGSSLSVNFIEVDSQTATIGASPNPVCENQTLNLTSSMGGTSPQFTNTVDITINNSTCYNSYINVTSTLNANQLSSVLLSITHTATADLDITLFAPNGSSIVLTSDNGGTGDNFSNTTFSTSGTAITAGTAPFSGTYTPEQAFSTLTGSASGMWRLQICDDASPNTGTFMNCRLNFPNIPVYSWSGPNAFTSSIQNPTINPVTMSNMGLYTLNITANSGCISTNSVLVTVYPLSTPLTTVIGDTEICSGESTSLSVAGGITGIGSTIRWYSGPNGTGSLLATGAAYTASPTVTTSYYVRRQGTCNTTTDYVVTVTVNSLSTSSMLAGDYIWTGASDSDWSATSNWKVFNGSSFVAAPGEPTSSKNVFIDQLSGCVLSIPDICCGPAEVNNLTVRPGAEMEISPNMTLEVYGSWINNSGIISNVNIATNSSVEFTDFLSGRNIGGTTTTQFGNLENTSPMYLDVNVETVVKGDLIITGSFWLNDRLILGISPSQRGNLICDLSSVTGWITGPSYFRRYFDASTNSGLSGFFPLGAMPSIFYRPVTLEYTTAPTSGGWIEARFVSSTLSSWNGLPIMNDSGVNITGYMDEGYWEMNPGGGLSGGQYSLKLRYDGINTPADMSTMRIIKSPDPHTTWVADGTHGALVAPNSITRTGMSGFSWFVVTNQSSALPVELTNLSSECKLNGIEIRWATASENNSSHFEIERSVDGKQWQNVGLIQAAGNSTQNLVYSYIDQDRIIGINYYRLRQLDIDGNEKTYGPISTSCFDKLSDEIIVYPNPNNGTFTTEFESSIEQLSCLVELKDVLGKVIDSKIVHVYNGINQVIFESEHLYPGEYIVSVTTEGELKMVKVVVM